MDMKRVEWLRGMVEGIVLALLLALVARALTQLPVLVMMGPMIIAILLGMSWRSLFGVPGTAWTGIGFSSKYLLRAGIILLGFTIDLEELYQAGPYVFLIALAAVLIGFTSVYLLAKRLHVDPNLSLLVASGTAICGAAAIAAVSAPAKAKQDESALSIAVIAILGTIFAVSATLFYHGLKLPPVEYGLFVGGTLHEIAHVVAAATPAGDAGMEMALLVKMTRVVLLIPVVILIGWQQERKGGTRTEKKGLHSLPIPWFILGFLVASLLNSWGVVPEAWTQFLVLTAYILMATAMAAMGLSVRWEELRRKGLSVFVAGLGGSLVLAASISLLLQFIKF